MKLAVDIVPTSEYIRSAQTRQRIILFLMYASSNKSLSNLGHLSSALAEAVQNIESDDCPDWLMTDVGLPHRRHRQLVLAAAYQADSAGTWQVQSRLFRPVG